MRVFIMTSGAEKVNKNLFLSGVRGTGGVTACGLTFARRHASARPQAVAHWPLIFAVALAAASRIAARGSAAAISDRSLTALLASGPNSANSWIAAMRFSVDLSWIAATVNTLIASSLVLP